MTEPLRPEQSSAPPRAEQSSATDEDIGFGGSGDVGTGEESAVEEENARLRAELQRLNAELARQRAAEEESVGKLQQINDTMVSLEAERTAAAEERAQVEAERVSALRAARDLLADLRPDNLHDSSAYASALDSARFELSRALDLRTDASSTAALRQLDAARDAFTNDDLNRMFMHTRAAVAALERSASVTP